MESVAFIQWCLDHLNYWTITLLMAIESSFIPFPSEVVVPPAAYKAAGGNSDLNVFLVVIFATIGANIGAIINYYIAYFVGRPLVYKFANSRFGHMCLIDEAKVQNAEHYFDKHGALSTFICIRSMTLNVSEIMLLILHICPVICMRIRHNSRKMPGMN